MASTEQTHICESVSLTQENKEHPIPPALSLDVDGLNGEPYSYEHKTTSGNWCCFVPSSYATSETPKQKLQWWDQLYTILCGDPSVSVDDQVQVLPSTSSSVASSVAGIEYARLAPSLLDSDDDEPPEFDENDWEESSDEQRIPLTPL
mmetsp:Transcript_24696/g.49114  ORF Transcript_24696/g.49114 Transcript_24696/m.49114 type:complete len:148 (-) Transcript_24696:417-860(-)